MNDETQTKSNKGPKACTTCARAKSRCIPGPFVDICERCHRLHKICGKQTPAPARKRKPPRTARVAELEKRLEDLTARVESRQVLSSTPSSDVSQPTESESSRRHVSKRAERRVGRARHEHHLFPYDSLEEQTQERLPTPSSECNVVSEGFASAPQSIKGIEASAARREPHEATSTCGKQAEVQPQGHQWSSGSDVAEKAMPWYYPSPEEAQASLDDHRDHNTNELFPFVVVPKEVTSEQLRRDRPLVWKGVMMKGQTFDGRRHILLGNELLHDIVTAAFVQPAKSLDLLQASLILIASFPIASKSFQLTNFLYLLRSICLSLDFNESSQGPFKQKEHSSASLERMRAFMGSFYLLTQVFTISKKGEAAFMKTDYIDQCCRVLEAQMEYPSDRLAVHFVRIQRLSQSISMTLAPRDNPNLDIPLMVQKFEREIDQLRDLATDTYHSHPNTAAHLYVAEILLYETGLNEEASAGLSPEQRLELLRKCLQSVRAFMEIRFRKVNHEWPQFICLCSFDYAFSMLVCLKLLTMHIAGWDLRLARKELDADRYLLWQIEELRDFTAERHRPRGRVDDGEGTKGQSSDPFVRAQKRMSQLRMCIMAEMASDLPESGDANEVRSGRAPDEHMAVTTSPPTTGLPGHDFVSGLVDDFNDPFWQDMYNINEWETNFSALLGWGPDDVTGPIDGSWMDMGSV